MITRNILLAVAIGLVIGGIIHLAPQSLVNAIFHRGIGACGRCERTWDVVEGHDTPYADAVWHMVLDGREWVETVTNGLACFPLCEQCWIELETPEARLPYYRALVDEWKAMDSETETRWPLIKKAVMEGK